MILRVWISWGPPRFRYEWTESENNSHPQKLAVLGRPVFHAHFQLRVKQVSCEILDNSNQYTALRAARRINHETVVR